MLRFQVQLKQTLAPCSQAVPDLGEGLAWVPEQVVVWKVVQPRANVWHLVVWVH